MILLEEVEIIHDILIDRYGLKIGLLTALSKLSATLCFYQVVSKVQ